MGGLHHTPMTEPTRRALLLMLAAMALTAPVGLTWGAAQPVIIDTPLPAGPAHAIWLDIAGEADNRVVFSTLRSTASLQSLTLVNPAGQTVWHKTPRELGWMPAAAVAHPEWGDAMTLPEIRNAAPGRWQLRLARPPSGQQAGRLQLSYRVLPRFDLSMSVSSPRIAAGQSLLVTLRPTDYGEPVSGLAGIPVQILMPHGAAPVNLGMAQEGLRTATGIQVSTEAGTYLLHTSFPQAGALPLQASVVFNRAGQPVMRTASASVQVDASAASLSLGGISIEQRKQASCASGVRFTFQAQVTRPGTYACNMVLRGRDGQTRQLSTSAELAAAGPAQLSIPVSASMLHSLKLPLSRVEAIKLLYFAPAGIQVMATLDGIDLQQHPMNKETFCP